MKNKQIDLCVFCLILPYSNEKYSTSIAGICSIQQTFISQGLKHSYILIRFQHKRTGTPSINFFLHSHWNYTKRIRWNEMTLSLSRNYLKKKNSRIFLHRQESAGVPALYSISPTGFLSHNFYNTFNSSQLSPTKFHLIILNFNPAGNPYFIQGVLIHHTTTLFSLTIQIPPVETTLVLVPRVL